MRQSPSRIARVCPLRVQAIPPQGTLGPRLGKLPLRRGARRARSGQATYSWSHSDGVAAVDRQVLASDVGSGVGQQEAHRTHNFFSFTPAAQRDLLQIGVAKLL